MKKIWTQAKFHDFTTIIVISSILQNIVRLKYVRFDSNENWNV